jgi:hypothetical protein
MSSILRFIWISKLRPQARLCTSYCRFVHESICTGATRFYVSDGSQLKMTLVHDHDYPVT